MLAIMQIPKRAAFRVPDNAPSQFVKQLIDKVH